MTLSKRSSRQVYQHHPIGAPNGVLSSPLARFTSTNGASDVTSETTRARLFDASNPFTTSANWLNRLVTIRSTPPAAGSAGTRKMDNWTFRITAVDGAGGWIQLEGCRFDDAGTNISYVVHSCAEFSAASAVFPTDDGGPGIPERANTGPVIGQALFFPNPTDQRLRLLPFEITGRTSGTALRVSDTFDLLDAIPAETNLQWQLRDRPAYSYEDLYKLIHRFLLTAGWSVFQFRGRNNGAGAGRRLLQDIIYYSDGESQRTRQYLRFVAGQTTSTGDYGSGGFGFDWAFFSVWDRAFANASASDNPGNGVNAVHINDSASNTQAWAAQADTANNLSNSEPAWSPDSALSTIFSNGPTFGAGPTLQPHPMNAPDGGELVKIHYTFFGNKDAVELFAEAYGFGHSHISMGSLAPRPVNTAGDVMPSFFTNSRITNGSNVVVRIGGSPTDALNNGINPQAPGAGFAAYQVGDSIQIVGQRVNAGIVPATSHSGEFIESTSIVGFPGLLAARGTITTPSGASLNDGETFTLNDGTGAGGPSGNGIYVFEWDSNASVSGTNIAVTFTGGMSADQTRDAVIAAINGTLIGITASIGGTGQVALINDVAGGAGNRAITETVNNVGFVVDGMDGGGYSLQLQAVGGTYAAGALCGEDPQPLYLARPGNFGSSSVDPFATLGAIRLSNRARFNDATYRDHNGPTMASGNGFSAILTKGALTDLGEVNPNVRTGRFAAVQLIPRDTAGNQLRGTLRHLRVGSPRMGAFEYFRDRDGRYYLSVPLQLPAVSASSELISRYVALFGSMPAAMVVVG